ncbi:hypothetical protein HYQ46_006471 [Verticillium longisporum]|nr:hypothetical protein HYQ46_006471 [Verticillium longisporum]
MAVAEGRVAKLGGLYCGNEGVRAGSRIPMRLRNSLTISRGNCISFIGVVRSPSMEPEMLMDNRQRAISSTGAMERLPKYAAPISGNRRSIRTATV